MTLYSSELALGTRDVQPNFILSETSSPNGFSRKYVTVGVRAQIRPGDLVQADGAFVTNEADAFKVIGIALEYGGYGDIIAVLSRDADIKDTIFDHNGVTLAARPTFIQTLSTLGIDIVTCSPDAAF